MLKIFGRSPIATLIIAIVSSMVISTTIFGMQPLDVAFEEGVEIIRSQGYPINENISWNEIKAAGIKVTETSWKGFGQFCERFVAEFGNFKVYIDAEVRVLWVYADPTASQADTEAYYVQFP